MADLLSMLNQKAAELEIECSKSEPKKENGSRIDFDSGNRESSQAGRNNANRPLLTRMPKLRSITAPPLPKSASAPGLASGNNGLDIGDERTLFEQKLHSSAEEVPSDSDEPVFEGTLKGGRSLTPFENFSKSTRGVALLARPALLPRTADPSAPLQYCTNPAGERHLARAKLSNLIETLICSPGGKEEKLTTTFLITHEMIIPSVELCQRFCAMFQEKSQEGGPSQEQHRLLEVLTIWLEKYPTLFDRESFVKLKEWATNELSDSPLSDNVEGFVKTLSLAKEAFDARGKFALIKKVSHCDQLDILDFTCTALAKQLTLIDHGLFVAIQPYEFINLRWNTKGKELESAPNVTTMIDRFNQLSFWIMAQIVSKEDIKVRAEVVGIVIKLAIELHRVNNYFGMMAIYTALNGAAVQRLKRTFKVLPVESKEQLAKLQSFLNPEGNFQQYRTALRKHLAGAAPCIPFLGVIFSDLMSIAENEDTVEGLVNVEKLMLVGRVILEVLDLQKLEYDFDSVKHIQQSFGVTSFAQRPMPTEKEIYSQSLVCEARKKKKDRGSRIGAITRRSTPNSFEKDLTTISMGALPTQRKKKRGTFTRQKKKNRKQIPFDS